MAHHHLLLPIATTTTTILLLIIISPTPTTADPNPAILDTDGNPLEMFANYYILPAVTLPAAGGGAGGVTNVSTRACEPSRCTYYVGQDPNKDSPGHPVNFFNLDFQQQVIHESTDIIIVLASFQKPVICDRPQGWRVIIDDPLVSHEYVTTGAAVNVDDPNRWFRIQKAVKYSDFYQIVFCPGGNDDCSNIGVFTGKDEKTRFLGITEEPIVVKFQKVESFQMIKMVA